MNQKQFKCLTLFAVLMAGLGWASGCVESGSSAGVATQKKLPKLFYHCPESGDEAITRMKELVDGLVAEGEVPAPIEYTVREVIHGTGASGHSHYYLIKDGVQQTEDDEEEHHGDIESSEVMHTVQVDAFTELYDVVQWLPKMALKEHLGKQQWVATKKISDEMLDAMSIFDEKKTTAEQKRELIRSKSKQFSDWVEQVESQFGTASSKTAGSSN